MIFQIPILARKRSARPSRVIKFAESSQNTALFPMTEYPRDKIPCGCSRPHILVPKLDTIPEADDSSLSSPGFPSTTSPGFPSMISALSSKSVLGPDFDDIEDVQFNYYLPHISSSDTDFDTDETWVAFDTNDSMELEEEIRAATNLELPFIHEDDFQYYPSTESISSTSTGVTQDSKYGNSLRRSSATGGKKKNGDTLALEGVVGRLFKKLKLS